jgi:fused signal recognition particle receptor
MARLFRRDGDLPKKSFWQKVKSVVTTNWRVAIRGGVDQGSLEQLEQVLLESDFGVAVTLKLVAAVEDRARRGQVRTEQEFADALQQEIAAALQAGNADPAMHFQATAPTIILVLGVNGAGKTTFIGKLSSRLRAEGKRVLVGAGDTFRAGAIEQLKVWAQRTGADFVGASAGSDPAAVAFNAIDAGVTRGADVVIVDTAGRLHTSDALMDELRKVVRVIGKRLPGAPHEALLVLDGTIGQNAVQQARTFAAAVPLTGLVVTKLDGTAKGGVVVAVHEALDIPVKFIGTGESAEDLHEFNATEFAEALFES